MRRQERSHKRDVLSELVACKRTAYPPRFAIAHWKHHKRYQRLSNEAKALEKASKACNTKPVAFKTFAYHVAA